MTFLIDTNIISEVRKGDRGNPAVVSWWNSVGEDDLWLSPLVLGEIRKGVELVRPRDPRRGRSARGVARRRDVAPSAIVFYPSIRLLPSNGAG